jgi:hypothetical protein
MLERILPRSIDNCYSGHNLAIWCMIAIVFLKTVMGLTSTFAPRLAAENAHKIPLGAFSPMAAQFLLSALARAGLSTLVVAPFCLLVLMISLTYVLILVEHVGRAFLFLSESAITGISSALIVNFSF